MTGQTSKMNGDMDNESLVLDLVEWVASSPARIAILRGAERAPCPVILSSLAQRKTEAGLSEGCRSSSMEPLPGQPDVAAVGEDVKEGFDRRGIAAAVLLAEVGGNVMHGALAVRPKQRGVQVRRPG